MRDVCDVCEARQGVRDDAFAFDTCGWYGAKLLVLKWDLGAFSRSAVKEGAVVGGYEGGWEPTLTQYFFVRVCWCL